MSSRRSTTKRKSTVHIDGITAKKTSLSGLSLKPDIQQTRGSGSVFACGQNDVGQLGLGEDAIECKRPTLVKGLEDIVDICAGGMHSLCIDKKGQVYSWGCNDEFALGRETPSETEATVPGKVKIDEKVLQITAGDSHSAALTTSGKVYAWGSFRDSHGDLGLTPNGKQQLPILIMNNAAKIASGADHLLILSSNGLLYSLGCAEQGQLGRISGRFADRGSRRGLGNLLNPGLVPHPKTKFDDIWTGSWSSLVKEHNTDDIFAFGLNNFKQLGIPGNDETRPWAEISKSFSADKKWTSIIGGQHHTMALDNKGKVYSLGRKEYGRLGLGENCDDQIEPTLIPSLANKEITNIACGTVVSFAVTKEGEAYGWGMGTNYQLGNGSDDDVYEPQLVAGKQIQNHKIIKVSSGGQHSIFLAQPKE